MEQKIRKLQQKCWKLKGTEPKSKQKKNSSWKMKNAEPKDKEHKLKHEHKKRRKEGEEKAHEDGGMVG